MTMKTVAMALALMGAFSLSTTAFAADAPAPKPAAKKMMKSGHRKSCYDAAYDSPEFKNCESMKSTKGRK